jgi:hypothetical protein
MDMYLPDAIRIYLCLSLDNRWSDFALTLLASLLAG